MPDGRADVRAAFTRRQFLKSTSAAGLASIFLGTKLESLAAEISELPFSNGQRSLATFPQKRPLILLTSRPPQLETPFAIFNEGLITPNDAFFVRYHLLQVPTSIDPKTFKLEVKGKVNSPLTLSLADLRSKFEPVELIAVNQCSGNSRGFS